MTSEGLASIDAAECRALLGRATLGRVGLKHGELILVLPVYYALDGDDIVFRTDPGAKLDAAVLNTRVTFEVDDEREGWSVLVMGYAEEVRDAIDVARIEDLLADRRRVGRRHRIVRIAGDRLTGRRLAGEAGRDEAD